MPNSEQLAPKVYDGSTTTNWFESGVVGSGSAVLTLTLGAAAQVGSYQLHTASARARPGELDV